VRVNRLLCHRSSAFNHSGFATRQGEREERTAPAGRQGQCFSFFHYGRVQLVAQCLPATLPPYRMIHFPMEGLRPDYLPRLADCRPFSERPWNRLKYLSVAPIPVPAAAFA
jgi:hypothetical protein